MSPRLSELFLSSQSDERLVALARSGHERAFAAIVERYRPELQALARRLGADGRGEDVVQQAFLSAFAALRSGAEVKHLRGWLYRIVRNAAYRSRAPQSMPLDTATASAEIVEDVVEQRALAMSALTELARLPARQRQAMVATVGGMARSDVASTMGLSEGAVRQLVHRARSTLRTAVTAVTPWPMARWFAALGQSTPGSVELAAGAGAASSGGVMLKLGALVASGTLATGVAAVDLHGARAHRTTSRAATPVHAHASTHRAAALVLAAGSPSRPASAPTIEASRRVSQAGAGAAGAAQRRGRHEPADEGSGTGRQGSRGQNGGSGGRDGGAGSGGNEGSGSGGGTAGHGDSSSKGSGSGHPGDGGRRDGGSPGGGNHSGGPSGSIADAGSHGDHGDQTPTQLGMLDSAVDGSSSDEVSGSGDKSGSGSSGGSGGATGGESGSGGGSDSR